jgi:hypothetical protein
MTLLRMRASINPAICRACTHKIEVGLQRLVNVRFALKSPTFRGKRATSRNRTCGFKSQDRWPAKASKKKSPGLGARASFRGGTQPLHSCYMHPDFKRFPGLSDLLRCSASRGSGARLDIDCLGGLYGLRGLLDREMQYALVEMSVDGSVLWLEWQGYRSVE